MSEARIDELRDEIEDLQDEINTFEPDEGDFTDQYEELLDEMGDVEIGNLSYSPSHVLKNVDPIAYRQGLLDYIDGLDPSEFPEVQEMEERLEELKSELMDIEEEE